MVLSTVFLITVSICIGFETAKAEPCPHDELAKCVGFMMSAQSATDINAICKAMICFEKLSKTCELPSTEGNMFESQKSVLSMCSEDSNMCPLPKIMACLVDDNPHDDNPHDDNAGMENICKRMTCFKKLTETCELPPEQQQMLDSQKSLIDMCTGSSNVCRIDQIMGCVSLMQSAPEPGSSNITAGIEQSCKMLNCMKTLSETCELPAEQKAQFEMQKHAFALCSNQGAGNCSLANAMKCVAPMQSMQSMQEGNENLEEMCRISEETMKCLAPFKNCEGTVKALVQTSLEPLKAQHALCGCAFADALKCNNMFEKAAMDPANLCQATREFEACTKPVLASCKTEEGKKYLQEEISKKVQIDVECCEEIVGLQKCTAGLSEFADSFNASETQCKKLKSSISCISGFEQSCQEKDFAKGVKKAVKELKSKREECEENGYKITVDCTMEDAEECLKKFGGKTHQDPTMLCQAARDLQGCMQPVLSTCKTVDAKRALKDQMQERVQMDLDCCDEIVEMRECTESFRQLTENFNASQPQCKTLQASFVCINNLNQKCKDKEIQGGVHLAKDNMLTLGEQCTNNGYRVNTQAKSTSGNGNILHSSVGLLVLAAATGLATLIHG